jgi:hypothetical protein
MMVSNAALRHLNINPKMKGKIQAYFSLDMLTEISGALGAAGGANFIQQINSLIGTEIGSDSSNVTIEDVLQQGRLTKPMLYRILNSFGYNFTEMSRFRLNVTTQFDSLLALLGNTTWTINNP